MSISKKIFKWIAWGLISLFVVLVATVLVGRFYISPRIDQWRPQLVQWLQKNVHPSFQIGQMDLDWHYWTPSLSFQKVGLGLDNELATVGDLSIELDTFSLLKMQPTAKSVLAKEATVIIERNAAGEILVGGKVLSTQDDTLKAQTPLQQESVASLLSPWLAWGFERLPQDIRVEQGHIIWRDHYQEQRPDLSLAPVDFHASHNQQQLQAQLSIGLTEMPDSAVKLQADFNRKGNGGLQVSWKNWQPQYFKKWVHFPLFMKKGVIEEARADFTFEQIELKDFSTHWVLNDFVFLEQNNEDNGLILQGDKIAMSIASDTGLEHPYRFDIDTNNLHVQANDFFRHPMDFNHVQMQGQYRLNDHQKTSLQFDVFKATLPYGSFEVSGSWDAVPDSDNGKVQLQGLIHRMELNKLPYYLPKALSAESLDWLEKAFLKGYVENARVKVEGNVDHIPFGLRPESGDFQIQGPVKDVALHYHQFPAKDNTYWPDILVPTADVDFNRQTISIRGNSLQLDPKYGLSSIQASDAEVHVRNIEKNAVVDIRTRIKATGDSFLKFYRQSPLRPILSQALDKSQMSGQVDGQLQIHIPITHPEDTQVDSRFDLQQASFQFTPDHPAITQASGRLKITEKNIQLEGVQGRLLGGQTQLKGGIGAKGDRLSIQGVVTAQGVYEYLPLAGIKKRLTGQTAYTADFDFLGGDYIDLTVNSQLKGLGLALPQELSKSVDQSIPLTVTLKAPRNGQAEQLHIDYKNAWLQVLLERADRSKKQFNRGVIAVNTPATLPPNQMKLAVQSGQWDVMTWLDFVDEFTPPKTTNESHSLFPAMRYLQVDADRLSLFGAYVDKVSLLGERQGNDWVFNANATDTRGKVVLTLGKNAIDKIRLDVNRFNLKFLDKEKATEHQPTRVDLPAIEGVVRQFLLADKNIGRIEIKSEKRNKDSWHLNQLSLSNQVGSLYATGDLRSQGQQTAADIKFNANALDLGKFLGFFWNDGLLRAGKGQINARVQTADISDFSLKGLQLSGDMQLNNGSLLKVNSGAIKALALISLQSLSNLSNLANSTPSAFSKGLAFDYLRSNFELKNQQLFIQDFRLNGPLVAIVAAGNTHLQTRQLNFQAAAIPKLEMSGAAVLAGVIVNPIVGLGAFLSQWLLSEPLNRALTAYFSVTGTWDNPLINDKPLPSEEELREKRKQQEIDNLYRN
ncbi:MAG: AsmA-like C-terminal region-containing protein [Pelistega sp.]|nr:AsmA-like C-terminal region-containing protein [Pelistega sp.]